MDSISRYLQVKRGFLSFWFVLGIFLGVWNILVNKVKLFVRRSLYFNAEIGINNKDNDKQIV